MPSLAAPPGWQRMAAPQDSRGQHPQDSRGQHPPSLPDGRGQHPPQWQMMAPSRLAPLLTVNKRAVCILLECFLVNRKISNYLALWVLTTSCMGDVLLTVETLMFKAGLSSISSSSPLKRLTLPANRINISF